MGQLFEIVWVEHCDQDLCLAGEMLVIVIKICVGLVRMINCFKNTIYNGIGLSFPCCFLPS